MRPQFSRKKCHQNSLLEFSSLSNRLIGLIFAFSALFAIFDHDAQVQCGPTADLGSLPNVAVADQQQQQQQQPSPSVFLNQLQSQAQRQLNQLNGLMFNSSSSSSSSVAGPAASSRLNNVLETLSSVGKVIQQQISAANNHVNIVTSPNGGLASANGGELANNKKNEYQSIVITDNGSSLQPASSSGGSSSSLLPLNSNGVNATQMNNYREQSEQLRSEIFRRVGQLQQVVASSMDLMKNNGDLIVRRLLEQMNSRLDQAKAKADRIISEPATNEMALKALSAINLGLNNLNTIISNIVARLDLAAKEGAQRASNGGAANVLGQQAGGPLLLDAGKFRVNLQQIGQQFQAALNNSQLHQQFLQRQRQFLALQPPTAADQQQSMQNKVNLDFNNQKRN